MTAFHQTVGMRFIKLASDTIVTIRLKSIPLQNIWCQNAGALQAKYDFSGSCAH